MLTKMKELLVCLAFALLLALIHFPGGLYPITNALIKPRLETLAFHDTAVDIDPSLPSSDPRKRQVDQTTWTKAVGAGCKLVSLMEADIAGATSLLTTGSQSLWIYYSSLSTYGWEVEDNTDMFDWDSVNIETAVEGLSLSLTLPNPGKP